jgi:hypothetical protein
MTDGSYYLAENLRANQNGVDVINIFAGYVSIDLNGSIDGADKAWWRRTASDRAERAHVAVSNGTIRGCATASSPTTSRR